MVQGDDRELSKRTFSHPYVPYDIQTEFMSTLYDVIENARIGIFESPTGTGKSLSIICGAITWLRDDLVRSLHGEKSTEKEPEWLREYDTEHSTNELLRSLQLMHDRLKRVAHIRPQSQIAPMRIAKRIRKADTNDMPFDDGDFMLEDDDSDADQHKGTAQAANGSNVFSADVMKLLQESNHPTAKVLVAEAEDYPETRKIFFCSRTHSQLTQFAAELSKPRFPWSAPDVHADAEGHEAPRYVALSSRKNLCINSRVSKLPSEHVNDACLELQDKKTPAAKRCKFLSKDPEKTTQFRDHVLSGIRDIEDLALLGKSLEICPYYATRAAIPASEVVAMPYPLLLNKQARESLGVDLCKNVVIIDEAHNLVDAITDLSSVTISLQYLLTAEAQLKVYLEKFIKRLAGTNRMYINQLQRLVNGLKDFFLDGPAIGETHFSNLLKRGSDAVNIHQLVKYLHRSKLARKVEAYNLSCSSPTLTVASGTISLTPGVSRLQQFLECMENPSAEGRLLVQMNEEKKIMLRYILLDPMNAFADIVRDAHSVVLAGGTMQPIDDVIELLFARDIARVQVFSCGHIIPKDNLVAMTITAGPTNVPFAFTYEKRYNRTMLEDLGRLFNNLAGIIPDGMVVFFGSYNYMDHVLGSFRDSGQIALLQKKKPLYIESKAQSVEETLQTYTQSVHSGSGGLLFAVMGGKMSEGINFSDALGRAVFVVGVPFPNAKTPEWEARLDFVESQATKRLVNTGSTKHAAEAAAKKASAEHFENAAMRAVNQSIGRAIRHKDDYAMIFLLDVRYNGQSIRSKLPGWILDKFEPHVQQGFGNVVKRTSAFFRSKARRA